MLTPPNHPDRSSFYHENTEAWKTVFTTDMLTQAKYKRDTLYLAFAKHMEKYFKGETTAESWSWPETESEASLTARAGTKEFLFGQLGSLNKMLELADQNISQEGQGASAISRRRKRQRDSDDEGDDFMPKKAFTFSKRY